MAESLFAVLRDRPVRVGSPSQGVVFIQSNMVRTWSA